VSEKSYTLEAGEKATQIMIGTADLLVWGDLITKEHISVTAYLMTIAEDFVPLRDAKILFLAPTRQVAPIARRVIYIKREEILLFYSMSDPVPLPEETEVRRFEPLEVLVGPYQVQGDMLKSPIADLETVLLVSKDDYMPIYSATIRHVGKPWLGSFTTSMVQVRRPRMNVTVT